MAAGIGPGLARHVHVGWNAAINSLLQLAHRSSLVMRSQLNSELLLICRIILNFIIIRMSISVALDDLTIISILRPHQSLNFL